MTGLDVADDAKTCAKYLNLLAMIPEPLSSDLSAGAAALTALSTNTAECDAIAATYNGILTLVTWLIDRGYPTVAKALMARGS